MQVKSKLLKRGSQIPYKIFHDGGKEHYNVRIYLYAKPDTLSSINRVEYLLHSSFRNPRRVSTDRDNRFAIDIWTWGMFDIEVTVHFSKGEKQELKHSVKYSLPPDDGSNYVQL